MFSNILCYERADKRDKHKKKHDLRVYPHRASVWAAAAAANTKSMGASTQASSGTFEVWRLPLGVS